MRRPLGMQKCIMHLKIFYTTKNACVIKKQIELVLNNVLTGLSDKIDDIIYVKLL